MQNPRQPNQQLTIDYHPLIFPLAAIQGQMLPLVGGKAANLGEMMRAGLPVPDGFCVPTTAYALVVAGAGLEAILDELGTTTAEDADRLSNLAADVRTRLSTIAIPPEIIGAVGKAYLQLSEHDSVPVAVRSSATAEDLPTASFAGQQETYLNVIGIDAVLDAVRRCWASLWTDRAVAYRIGKGIDPRSVQLAVIVQRMVDAETAGVLFTANPITGKRRQAIIDASFGLGEAVVSGAVNPDHVVVNLPAGEIVERRAGDKKLRIQALPEGGIQREVLGQEAGGLCLTDEQIVALARLGTRVEAHFGAPQDIEWAIDHEGQIWLAQSRPITTLFPLPAEAPSCDDDLKIYLSFSVQQGTHRPITPMGISATRLLFSAIMALAPLAPSDRLHGPRFVVEAASRVFLDVTGALRNPLGRNILQNMMAQAEAQAGAIFEQLAADPRFAPVSTSNRRLFRTLGLLVIRTRLPWFLLRTLISPKTAHARLLRHEAMLREAEKAQPNADANACLTAVERLVFDTTRRLMSASFPVMLGSAITTSLTGKLLGDLVSASELQIILRGAPFNPTTEMNLMLWTLARKVQGDPATAEIVRNTSSSQLAELYLQRSLPALLQEGMADFLKRYGHRSVNELDLGVPRWSEDPGYLFEMLASFVQIQDPAQSPEVQYNRAMREAEAMMAELIARAGRRNRLRGFLVRFLLPRARALAGMREMPRYLIALMFAQGRVLLRQAGKELVQTGRLEAADDIFFVSLPEAYAALAGKDLSDKVRSRRRSYVQELARRHVPLVLLSDGTEPSVESDQGELARNLLRGVPISPGIVTGMAHVILDPHGAQLERGEILVAPSTDPGWTPLFLVAGGLVMETGGEISHGAIVAREYGIPAVAGVTRATERLRTGQRITVDGSAGTIRIDVDSA